MLLLLFENSGDLGVLEVSRVQLLFANRSRLGLVIARHRRSIPRIKTKRIRVGHFAFVRFRLGIYVYVLHSLTTILRTCNDLYVGVNDLSHSLRTLSFFLSLLLLLNWELEKGALANVCFSPMTALSIPNLINTQHSLHLAGLEVHCVLNR